MIPKLPKPTSGFTWFTTKNGQKFSLSCMIAFGGGAALFNLLPHSLLLDKYRELFQLHRKSIAVRVSSRIKKHFNTVLDDLEIPVGVRARLKPFMVNGFDIFHGGTTYLASGAVIGIPANFEYEDINDIDKASLLIQGRRVNWSEPDGQNLLSAIILSDDAKKFAIAREVVRSQTIEPLLNFVYPISCTTLAYIIGHTINISLNGFSRPLAFRLILYTLTGFFCLGNWALLKDMTTVHYDTECDLKISKLGKEYIKGGQEFYTKLLQRNMGLRNLMGKEGVRLYSVSGNEEFLIRHKRLPIIHRKLYFDQQMESLN